jgi:hypothetical protein
MLETYHNPVFFPRAFRKLEQVNFIFLNEAFFRHSHFSLFFLSRLLPFIWIER